MTELLLGWEHVREAPPTTMGEVLPLALPLDVGVVCDGIQLVGAIEEGQALLHTLRSVSIAAIALDSEFSYGRGGVPLRGGKEWHDVRSQRPICFSLAAWVVHGQQRQVLRAVLDVRQGGVVEALGEILRLRVPFVFHHGKPELFSLWSLGLDPDLPSLYDTFLAAACMHLGVHHRRGAAAQGSGGQAGAEAEKERAHAHLLSLRGQCLHYGLAYPYSDSKDELRSRFLGLGDGTLDARLVEYAAADAEWTLRLYLAQQQGVLEAGLHPHLHTVEFPFAVANARMEWNGVTVDPGRRAKVRQAALQAADHYADILREHGVVPPGSRAQFLGCMDRAGLGQHFGRRGQESVEDEVLEPIEGLHPAIRAYRLHKRYQRLAAEEWLTGALIGRDGRLHPVHGQLGAATGRNSCRQPNLAGIGRVLRPVVVAPPGRALIELDYSQIEVGVAAAEHDDPDLIAAYNSGDVYAAMAKRFYADQLPEADQGVPAAEFKQRHADLRDRMKTFVLAVLYNIQPPAIAMRFGISEAKATAERDRFLSLYPTLKRRLEDSAGYGAVRGFASTVSGLRRQRPAGGGADSWTRNFLRNTPIQGSAAVVFKSALVLLDHEFRGSSTMLVLPVHDSILIECDQGEADAVAARARDLMAHSLRSYYPKLRPRVDVNKADTSCWNKDGKSDSLDRFLQDPEIRIEECGWPHQV